MNPCPCGEGGRPGRVPLHRRRCAAVTSGGCRRRCSTGSTSPSPWVGPTWRTSWAARRANPRRRWRRGCGEPGRGRTTGCAVQRRARASTGSRTVDALSRRRRRAARAQVAIRHLVGPGPAPGAARGPDHRRSRRGDRRGGAPSGRSPPAAGGAFGPRSGRRAVTASIDAHREPALRRRPRRLGRGTGHAAEVPRRLQTRPRRGRPSPTGRHGADPDRRYRAPGGAETVDRIAAACERRRVYGHGSRRAPAIRRHWRRIVRRRPCCSPSATRRSSRAGPGWRWWAPGPPLPTGSGWRPSSARGLARAGVVVVSGLAPGIDAAAHAGALGRGRGARWGGPGHGARRRRPRR